jgi:hypothetical protein
MDQLLTPLVREFAARRLWYGDTATGRIGGEIIET